MKMSREASGPPFPLVQRVARSRVQSAERMFTASMQIAALKERRVHRFSVEVEVL